MDETLILRQARSKILLAILTSVAFVAIGLWMISDPDYSSRRSPEWVLFWGWFCALFFGFTAASGAHRLVAPTELVLSTAGFEVRGRNSRALVAWEAVERFFITKVRGTKLVYYELRIDGATTLSGWRALLPYLGHRRTILPGYLEQSPDEVCEIMESWRMRHGATA